MKKRIIFILILLMVFIPSIKAIQVSKDDVENKTYIIGNYMFTRNTSTNYDGTLTTERIMLAARSIYSSDESNMIIYYKDFRGVWVDATTNDEITPPSAFDIKVFDLEGTVPVEALTECNSDYASNTLQASTYVIGKYVFTRSINDSYDGKLNIRKIMLAAKSIEGNTEADMVVYYKNVKGQWINALTGEQNVNVPATIKVDKIDSLSVCGSGGIGDTMAPVVTIEGGNLPKQANQTLTLTCRDNNGVAAYYFGTEEPDLDDISLTNSNDLVELRNASLTKTVTSSGIYWLGCKDASDNFSKQSVRIADYQVNNLLEKIDGVTGVYNIDNYENSSNANYIIRNGTTIDSLDLASVPVGFVFRGYTNNLEEDLNVDTVTINANSTYFIIYDRMTYTATINSGVNGSIIAETVTQAGNTKNIGAEQTGTLTIKHGDTVRVTAEPEPSNYFNGWSGGYVSGSINPTIGGIVTEDISISASFSDLGSPVCTFGSTTKTEVGTNGTLELICTDDVEIITSTLAASAFTFDNNNFEFVGVNVSNITNGKKFVITLKANATGITNISLNAGVISDNEGNKNIGNSATLLGSKTIAINYTGNGGNGSVGESTCEITTGETCRIYLNNNGFTRSGWQFAGWSTSSISQTPIEAGSAVDLSSSATYYAIWIKPEIRFIGTFDGNGGTSNKVVFEECIIPAVYNMGTQSSSCMITLPENEFVREGWEFVGWSDSPTGTTGSNPGKQSILNRNKTWYAIWMKPAITRTATLNGNGGTPAISTATCDIPAIYNTGTQADYCTVTLPETGFAYEGWKFNGWSANPLAQFGTVVYADLYEDKTYYATWKQETTE